MVMLVVRKIINIYLMHLEKVSKTDIFKYV